MNVAVILAGGSGKRLGAELPKQFLEVCGRSIIEYSVDAFQRNEFIDEVVIVVNKDYVRIMNELVSRNRAFWTKFKAVLHGGNERYDSSLSAIKAYENVDCNLIFHDAVRPLVSQQIITNVAKALNNYNAVAVAIPATDTIIEIDESGKLISRILKRSQLRCQQTPQAFKNEIIANAYKSALKDENFVATDDCGVVAKYLPDEEIFVVDGEDKNIKITYPKDLQMLEKLIGNY